MKSMKTILKIISDEVININKSTYNLDGVNYGCGYFNPDWVSMIGIDNPTVIFDVGCYDGGDSIKFKKRYTDSNVYSFEASPLRQPKLEITANKYGFNLINYAVSDKNGESTFYESLVDNDRVDAQGSLFKHTDTYKTNYPRIIQQPNGVTVKTIRLDTFCENNGIKNIDVAHIDVEGAEMNVIIGLGELRPKIIFVETLDFVWEKYNVHEPLWDGATNSKELHDILISMGYRLVKDLDSDRLYFHENILI